MNDERRTRIETLGADARYAAALDPAAAQLSELLGIPITRTKAASRQAVVAACDASHRQDRAHFVWHRVWGVKLRPEFLATTRRLAALLTDEHVILVCGRNPAVGFEVPLAVALTQLPESIGPESSGLLRSDVLLVAGDQAADGLRFGYHHHAYADQYELLSWGRFARSVEA